MPLNIRIQWNAGTACVSECVLKTLWRVGVCVSALLRMPFGLSTPEESEKSLEGGLLGPPAPTPPKSRKSPPRSLKIGISHKGSPERCRFRFFFRIFSVFFHFLSVLSLFSFCFLSVFFSVFFCLFRFFPFFFFFRFCPFPRTSKIQKKIVWRLFFV